MGKLRVSQKTGEKWTLMNRENT